MEMKLITSLAIVTTLLVHHLSHTVTSIADHTTVANTSTTGFSLRLVAHHEGPDYTIRRSNDGFLHLQHNLHADIQPYPPSVVSSSVANVTTLRPEMNTPVVLPYALAVQVGTEGGRHQYRLKVDTSSPLTWLQCKPCMPQARQDSPLFDRDTSPTFHHVPGTNQQICRPPYQPVFSGSMCMFHFTGPRSFSIMGYISLDHFTLGQVVHQNFVFGCSHGTQNFQSEGVYAGVATIGTTPTSLVMQVASRGLTQFSYCLYGGSKTDHQGFLRFGTDVPWNPRYRTTRILPALDADGPEYYVGLVGVSLGTRRLHRIRPEMFVRSKDGKGGCVIDLGTPLTVMIQEAYRIIEEAVWLELQGHKAERVKQPGYGLCVRATKVIKGRLQSLSLHFSEEEAVLVISPEQLFLMMDDELGQIACLAMTPGHRTVIGALQQVDTRFVFDLKDSKLSFASESCTQDTAEVI